MASQFEITMQLLASLAVASEQSSEVTYCSFRLSVAIFSDADGRDWWGRTEEAVVYRLIFEKSEEQTYYLQEKKVWEVRENQTKAQHTQKTVRKQQESIKANFLHTSIVLKWKS